MFYSVARIRSFGRVVKALCLGNNRSSKERGFKSHRLHFFISIIVRRCNSLRLTQVAP